MKTVNVKDVKDNVVDEFKNKRALITARKKDGTFNMCTISWGSIGELWSKDVLTAYVKPIRFTDSFLHEDSYFTVTFFNEEAKKNLALCGSKSGREINKMKIDSLKPIVLENGITFEGFKRVYVSKKIYQAPFVKQGFVDSKDIIEKYYKDEPFHNMYVGEIITVLEN